MTMINLLLFSPETRPGWTKPHGDFPFLLRQYLFFCYSCIGSIYFSVCTLSSRVCKCEGYLIIRKRQICLLIFKRYLLLLLGPSHLAVPLIATQTSYNAVPFNSFNLPAGQKWHSVFIHKHALQRRFYVVCFSCMDFEKSKRISDVAGSYGFLMRGNQPELTLESRKTPKLTDF
jgi:hypothetical protein